MSDYIERDAAIELVNNQGIKADAINALARMKTALPKWISVTERLPEKHRWALVVGENLYDMDFINSRGVWNTHDKAYAPIDYWMPLPAPPKEETE